MAEPRSTFILRLWAADNSPAGERIPRRGRVVHTQSGEHLYFDHIAEALSFISAHFGDYEQLSPLLPSHTGAGDDPSTKTERKVEQ